MTKITRAGTNKDAGKNSSTKPTRQPSFWMRIPFRNRIHRRDECRDTSTSASSLRRDSSLPASLAIRRSYRRRKGWSRRYWRETAPAASVTLVWPLQAACTSLLREHESAPFFFGRDNIPSRRRLRRRVNDEARVPRRLPLRHRLLPARRNTGRGIGKPDPVHRISIHKSG